MNYQKMWYALKEKLMKGYNINSIEVMNNIEIEESFRSISEKESNKDNKIGFGE